MYGFLYVRFSRDRWGNFRLRVSSNLKHCSSVPWKGSNWTSGIQSIPIHYSWHHRAKTNSHHQRLPKVSTKHLYTVITCFLTSESKGLARNKVSGEGWQVQPATPHLWYLYLLADPSNSHFRNINPPANEIVGGLNSNPVGIATVSWVLEELPL